MFLFQKHLNHDIPFDPQVDRDLIDSVDEMYYEDKSVDPGLHEIKVSTGLRNLICFLNIGFIALCDTYVFYIFLSLSSDSFTYYDMYHIYIYLPH